LRGLIEGGEGCYGRGGGGHHESDMGPQSRFLIKELGETICGEDSCAAGLVSWGLSKFFGCFKSLFAKTIQRGSRGEKRGAVADVNRPRQRIMNGEARSLRGEKSKEIRKLQR